tara:strand:- start:320 stop:529 length:210 start_codon:yes stop_codon:yes gene_type:complete
LEPSIKEVQTPKIFAKHETGGAHFYFVLFCPQTPDKVVSQSCLFVSNFGQSFWEKMFFTRSLLFFRKQN